ncbi:hypothetical protein ACN42_g2206 [Penicillium freii]|uniref:Uncharacterized protein n=1 Tax=Penicillium freii TaxID=48697 RepID=A0A117NR21_PENFR|nr:hypothetical protein ACN42_g2206 [Penicillium freii]
MAIPSAVLWMEPLLKSFFANLPTQLKSIPNWRVNKVPRISSLVNVRAALGQLIGHEAPAGAACVPCASRNGTVGDASDPPRWLYDVVRQFQPNSVLLKDPGCWSPAKTGAPIPTPAGDKDKGKKDDKGKSREKGKDKDQTAAGPSTPGKSPKKRAAEDSPREKDKTGKKKKKKTKEVLEPPI